MSPDIAAILQFLNASPVISAAFLSSLLTLIGVVITQTVSSRHLSKKLQHDKLLKREEHEAEIRRDIYFGALESLVNSVATIRNLPNIEDISKLSLNVDTAVKSTKLDLIADFETIKIFKKAEMILSFKLTKLSGLIFDWQMSKMDAQGSQTMIDTYNKISADLLAEMKALNDKKNHSPELWESLNAQSDENHRQLTEEIQKRHSADTRAAEIRFELMKQIASDQEELTKAIAEVILHFRKDMGLRLAQESEYISFVIAYTDAQGDLIKGILKDVDNRFLEIKKETASNPLTQ